MENDDLKYNGCCGSFEGLYTFLDAAKIYGVGDSCFRKQVARKKLVEGVDVKKMGTTWIITEQALVRNFGVDKLLEYKQQNNVLNNE